jgi:hypothetical protein
MTRLSDAAACLKAANGFPIGSKNTIAHLPKESHEIVTASDCFLGRADFVLADSFGAVRRLERIRVDLSQHYCDFIEIFSILKLLHPKEMMCVSL